MTSIHAGARMQYSAPMLGGPPSDKRYRFPIEGEDVIVETLRKLEINDIHEHDLQRPNQQVALTCFLAFVELLSYVNDPVVESIKADCLDKLDHKELYDESLTFLIRFIEIRALMIASCITDFCIPDITRPKPKRFKKQMFALINFLRFSEHHIQHFDDLKGDKDKIFSDRDILAAKVASLEKEVEEEERIRKSQEVATQRLRDENAKLSDKLMLLQEAQKEMKHDYDSKKEVQSEAKARCDGLKRECEALGAEIEKLQVRIDNTPTQLRDQNENQRRRLREKEQACQEEEVKAQGMAQKKRVLEGLEADIATCTQLVKSCLEDQMRLTREQQELDKLRKDRAEMAEERDNLTLQMEQTKQKMKFAMDRLEKTQRSMEMKREEARRTGEMVNEKWQEAQREKKQRQEQAEMLHRQVTSIEQEYESITRNFDAFYADLAQQKEKLERQSRTYMQAIAQRMDLQIDIL